MIHSIYIERVKIRAPSAYALRTMGLAISGIVSLTRIFLRNRLARLSPVDIDFLRIKSLF